MRPTGRSFLALVAAAAVGRIAVAQLDVQCSGLTATLSTHSNNSVSYSCVDGGGSKEMPMQSDFQVNVTASSLVLDLQGGSTIVSLNITSASGGRTLVSNQTELDFTSLSNMYSLGFEGVTFHQDVVELLLSSTVRYLHIVNSSLTDLSILSNNLALTSIDLADTSFTRIPKVLYEREYAAEMNITVDLLMVNGTTKLSKEQQDVLMSNVQEEYDAASCQNDTQSPSGTSTISCSRERDSSSSSSYAIPAGRNVSSDSGSTAYANAGDNGSSRVSTGVLVAIIVVVVVIAVVLAFFILRMYFRRKAASANTHNNEATATLMSKGDATADKGSFISNDELLRNFRLPQSDVSLVKSMGTGRLWMGEYNNSKVVVKRVESEVTDSYVTKALMAQARTFATISHPNITNLVGVTWLAGTDFAVVTEFMDKGNLKTVLTNTDVDLDVSTKLQMCCDIALALAYLHETEQNLCAKQLSSRKVLVNKAMDCKLSLFECVPSSAKLGGPSTAATYSYGMGEVAWLSPEVITRSSPMDARKNNIYAFGVLVSEIFTRVSPYQSLVEELGNTMSDVELVKRVRRQDPLVPHENRREFLEAPASVRQMVERCLSYAPMSRPTAKDLVEVLHNAKEEVATNSI
ncbi:hypothetical protein PHYPSEUDO_005399 [Phytophthora pseudosyringae]|uniref:Protein kinase domain-containing protein n=1 Tax=Phytophthora pseudosyringae TaxID=221518 RepID=A0A8T1VL08_9STRA|nr:hypothetical protein PHYPSEUDO_005399 [Phytophthora pseudosyringae]